MTRRDRFPSPSRKGLKPEWASLPRRRCDNCNEMYKPARPLLEGQRGFCKANCRKEYHKHGGAYRKLKTELEKLIEKRLRSLVCDELTKREPALTAGIILYLEKHPESLRQIIREEIAALNSRSLDGRPRADNPDRLERRAAR